jgi:hypothetical protein
VGPQAKLNMAALAACLYAEEAELMARRHLEFYYCYSQYILVSHENLLRVVPPSY